MNYQLTDVFNLSIFNKYKNKFNNNELAAFNYISTKLNNNLQNFTLIFQNDVIVSDLNHIKEVCNQMINNYNHVDYRINLFKIVLYKYQINNELGFLWKKDFSKHLESLSFYINQIETFVSKINTKMEFSVQTSHPNLPIIGEIDILENNDTIIDIKFINIHIKQILQLLLYYNNLFPDWKQTKKLKIFNFYQSRVYTINIDPALNHYKLLKILCRIINEKMKNCLFVYDLETTSLDVDNCQIIERYFKEYNLNFYSILWCNKH